MESLFIESIEGAIAENSEPIDKGNCLLILSSTKGNIDLLDASDSINQDAFLGSLSENVNNYFGFFRGRAGQRKRSADADLLCNLGRLHL